jgi:hypothetical protein
MWFDSLGAPISESEWLGCVARNDDLDPTDDGVLWRGHPDELRLELVWEEGRISADDLDEHVRRRLALLAAELGAELEGDDGTVYGPDGEPVEPENPTWPADADIDDSEEEFTLEAGFDDSWRGLAEVWDPDRPTSRADFFRSFFRRD